MSSGTALGIGLVLLLANAFFVGAEFALISARRTQVEPRAEAGSRAARITLRGMENVSLMMAGAQLGITMCSLGLGAVGEPAQPERRVTCWSGGPASCRPTGSFRLVSPIGMDSAGNPSALQYMVVMAAMMRSSPASTSSSLRPDLGAAPKLTLRPLTVPRRARRCSSG